MGIGVIFSMVMVVTRIGFLRCQPFQPGLEIVMQSGIIVINEHTGGDMHGITQQQSFPDTAFLKTIANSRRNIDQLAPLSRLKP
jgi:hypothetical protein